MDEKYNLTAQTIAALEQELHYLQTIRWREIEEMLEEARWLGDLSESVEYDFARTEQNKCIESIRHIEHILSHAVIIDAEGQEHPYHFFAETKVKQEPLPTSGQCGENLFWELRDETLYISGAGPMENYGTHSRPTEPEHAPWYGLTEQFHHIIIGEGATTIGSRAFEDVEVEDIIIPDSVKVIESWAFFNAILDRLNLRDTLETLKPNAISASPSTNPRGIGTLVLSVNIPHIQRMSIATELMGSEKVILTGTLPEDLEFLAYSHLFEYPADRIWYPGEWDIGGETFYEKLSQALLNAGGFYGLCVYTREDLRMLKQRLIPMD